MDDLVQWLTVAELEMTRLLERPSEGRIEETEDIENSADMGKLHDDDDRNELVLAAR